MKRRNFLKLSSLAAATPLLPSFLRAASDKTPKSGRKLVVIQLSGGNDGLNTFIPYLDDHYYRSRSGLAIPPSEVLKLNDYQGLHPALAPLRPLYDQGYLSLLNRVGYPNPDRSHFRSMDIWHTGSNSDEYWHSGWLGRYLDHSCSHGAGPHHVLEIDDMLSLATKGESAKAIAVQKPWQLYQHTQEPWLQALEKQGQAISGAGELDYLYKTLTETVHSAAYIHEQAKIYKSQVEYPAQPLGRQLKLIAELICSGIETPVFYASISGFDTHVRQANTQRRLFTQYAESVAAFVEDLQQNDRFDETLIMTFSEFGRRVEQNASGGTDHGKANNLWLIGGALRKPGIYNAAPDLARLDAGDVAFDLDFRQVYATVLGRWLGADDTAILRRRFKHLRLI